MRLVRALGERIRQSRTCDLEAPPLNADGRLKKRVNDVLLMHIDMQKTGLTSHIRMCDILCGGENYGNKSSA